MTPEPLAGHTMSEDKERAAFEAWYVADAIRQVPDLSLTVEDMRELREGDGYGQRRAMLQGKWEGWLAGRASLAQQAGEDARDGWQPIATAPKDGTPILVRGRFREVEISAWNAKDTEYPWVMLDAGMGSGTNSRMDGQATHWAPIFIPPFIAPQTPKETP